MKLKMLKSLALICISLALAISINQYSKAEDPEPECTLSVTADIELAAGYFWWEASFTPGCSGVTEWAFALIEWEGLEETVYGPYWLNPPSTFNPISDNFEKKPNVDRATIWACAVDDNGCDEQDDDTDPDW